MIGKRGSHVGVIASFTLFVFFMIVLYFIMEPTLTFKKDKQVLADSIREGINKEFSGNLTTAIVYSSPSTCLTVANSDIGVSGVGAVAKNQNGASIISGFSPNNLIIDPPGTNLTWIYYSEGFAPSSKSDSGCSIPDIYSIRTTHPLFLGKIELGVSNFSELKTKLGVPSGSDLAISFEYEGGNVIYAGENKTSGNIYVKEIPIQYVDQSANILSGKMRIKVW